MAKTPGTVWMILGVECKERGIKGTAHWVDGGDSCFCGGAGVSDLLGKFRGLFGLVNLKVETCELEYGY